MATDVTAFNTGTGCKVPKSGGWCVDVIGCESRCEWPRDEFGPCLEEALRDPDMRAACEAEVTP